jgi:eukaryotic-like serine/threonine-protein kinase
MSSWERFPPAPGTKLDGRFVVEHELGRGGMSVVLSAQHLGLGRRVAVKLLRPEFVLSADLEGRFLREAQAIARFKSEHVVDVIYVGTLASGIPYFVMEHLSGIDLGALVQKRGPLEVDDVVEYTLQTLEALVEAHRGGIVHRDLKPANLFLTRREDGSAFIKVLDFGVAKLVDSEVTDEGVVTSEGMVLGSPHYMSPEQIQDASAVDARSDIWSVGAVMHELLTGRPPFEAQEIAQVIRAIVTRPYVPPDRKGLPAALVEILRGCLRKSRGSRFQSALQLASAFQPLVRTANAQMSIDRILSTRSATVPPPAPRDETPALDRRVEIEDERLNLPSITPVESDTIPGGRFFKRPKRFVPAGLAVAFAVGGAVLLWLNLEDRPPPAVSPVAARVAPPPVPRPSVALAKAPKPVASIEALKTQRLPARSPTASRSSVAPAIPASAKPRAATTHVARYPDVVESPPLPLRRPRPLDKNPFKK